MTPRGLRNNNPGNIRISKTIYKGEIVPSQDSDFKQFESMEYGYRAIFMLLKTYYIKHGLKTIRQWLNRYAPPVENNTNSYISFVSDKSGIDSDKQIDINDKEEFSKIVFYISYMENGIYPDMEQVKKGFDLL